MSQLAEDGIEYKSKYDPDTNVFKFYEPYNDSWVEFESVEVRGNKPYAIGTHI